MLGKIRRLSHFNPRSPWGERPGNVGKEGDHWKFQSTLPVGGATILLFCSQSYHLISIHAPRGGSDITLIKRRKTAGDFNPRSPWGERPVDTLAIAMVVTFQSTLPVGGATIDGFTFSGSVRISIHAPRGGSDHFQELPKAKVQHFNPRSPWGERP